MTKNTKCLINDYSLLVIFQSIFQKENIEISIKKSLIIETIRKIENKEPLTYFLNNFATNKLGLIS